MVEGYRRAAGGLGGVGLGPFLLEMAAKGYLRELWCGGLRL